MAAVTFTSLWINPQTDPSTGIKLRLAALTSAPQQPAEIRQYGTRLRAVTTGVKAQQLTVAVRCDTRTQIAFLEANEAQTVCVRGPRGRKFYAIYLDPQIPEQPSPDAPVTVTMTFNEVTFDETV